MQNMMMHDVASSELQSVGYDAAVSILEVKFQNGRLYRYQEVPQPVFVDLLRATSKGRFFNAEIRDLYLCERVE